MIRMTLSEYLRKPKDYRGEWTTERWDIPNWKEERKKYMGQAYTYDKCRWCYLLGCRRSQP